MTQLLKIGDFSSLAQVSVKTVRYYDKQGLLKPAWIDRYSGYRYYTADQLSRLNRIMALKDLGLSLAQIKRILEEPISLDELRGMLRLKHAELEHHIKEEQARLNRIEARLSQIEHEDDFLLSLGGQHKENLKMEPEIITKPAFRVVGLRYFGDNKDNGIPKLWGQLIPRMEEIGKRTELGYGVCGDMDENGRYHYMAGFEVNGEGEIPEGMESWEVPAQTYAVFPCTIPTIGETYEYIFHEWLPQSSHQKAEGPDFEFYPEEYHTDSNPDMAIYLPIS